jgi:hypothetical protein
MLVVFSQRESVKKLELFLSGLYEDDACELPTALREEPDRDSRF